MISVPCFDENPVAVMGLGKSGLSAARSLSAGGSEVWAWDDSVLRRNEAEGLKLVDLYSCNWDNLKTLVLSPGIPDQHPIPHAIAAKARDHRCDIICDVDLLARSIVGPSFVGVTGTNGKSTTTALIGHILTEASRDVQIGGNFGVPALELEPLGDEGTYVLELSSYQLERIPSVKLNVTILLNISPDHLDRHGGFEGYLTAKKSIFDRTNTDGHAIIGMDDPNCRHISLDLMMKKVLSSRNIIPISANGRVAGGVYAEGSSLIDDIDNEQALVLDLAKVVTLPGPHNWQNIAAAFAAARVAGVMRENISDAIQGFSGLPHRQELVRTLGQVRYINDSKATNAEAAEKALACYENIHWIAGGQLKEGSIDNLKNHIGHVQHAYLIGEAAQRFTKELEGNVEFTRSKNLETAVEQAHQQAQKANCPAVVLFSPACASFDQFENFEDRGDGFRAAVEVLE